MYGDRGIGWNKIPFSPLLGAWYLLREIGSPFTLDWTTNRIKINSDKANRSADS